ncbi:MAG: carboxymuconolactone decarboxylase family protein, partial [Phycisphaerales bacterium]
ETQTGSNKSILDGVKKAIGMVPNLHRTVANSPAALQGYVQFAGALAGGKLDPKIREQIAILTAETNSCEYCLSAHTLLGKSAGLNPSELEAARHGESADAKTTAALGFAKAVLAKQGGVTEADVAAARKGGVNDAELAEIVAHVGLNVFTNFFNRAFDVDLDFPRVALHQHA